MYTAECEKKSTYYTTRLRILITNDDDSVITLYSFEIDAATATARC